MGFRADSWRVSDMSDPSGVETFAYRQVWLLILFSQNVHIMLDPIQIWSEVESEGEMCLWGKYLITRTSAVTRQPTVVPDGDKKCGEGCD